jgi:hypothetical protein
MEDFKDEETSQEKTENDQAEKLKPIELTDRDIQAFRLIHEQRYLAYSHIKRAFWENCSEIAGACYHRLEKLIETGYLVTERLPKKKLSVYLMTEKSYAEILRRGLGSGMTLFRMNDFYRNSMDHDLKVTNLRIFFRKHGLDGWTSERILKERDFSAKVPDGVLNVSGHRIAIEFENSIKGRKRYGEIFNHYRQSKEYHRVFMIVNEEIKDWALNLDYDPSQVWFVNYKDLFRKQHEAVFENKEASFVLARIL